MPKIVGAAEAVKAIEYNNRVYIHSVAAAPQVLIDAMVARAPGGVGKACHQRFGLMNYV